MGVASWKWRSWAPQQMHTHAPKPWHSSAVGRQARPVSLALWSKPGSVGPPMPALLLRLVLIALPLVLGGCGDSSVTSYRIPKEPEPDMPAAAAHAHAGTSDAPAPGMGDSMANTAVATAAGPGLAWTAPAHWQPKAGSAMRKGSYAIPGEGGVSADLAITAFPGDVGGEVANVNRWRGQLQLPPVSGQEVGDSITRVGHNGLDMSVVDIVSTGAAPTRVLGAWVPHENSTWFFKLTGPDDLVAREKAAFLEFLKTVRPAAQP